MALTKASYSMITGAPANVLDYGATGDGTTDDTAAIQAALDANTCVVFPPRTYRVTSITIDSFKTIYCNGAEIKALSDSFNPVVITGRYNSIFNLKINCNFFPNIAGMHWVSDATHTCQYNNVYGLQISDAVYGILFGAKPGGSAFNAPQSENTIYGYTTRATQIAICCNQPNGALTLVSPILNCDAFEWVGRPGYNATTYYTNAYSVINLETLLTVVGGEVLKTASQLGYGIWGGGVFDNVVFEVAGPQALITRDLTIANNQNGFFASDSQPAFMFDAAAEGDQGGAVLTLTNYKLSRPDGYTSYAGNYLIDGNPTLSCRVVASNVSLKNYNPELFLDTGATNIALTITGLNAINYNSGGTLIGNIASAVTSSNGGTLASATTINPKSTVVFVSGTAAIDTITVPYFGFAGSITLIPTGTFTTTTAGNIATPSIAIVGRALVMTIVGSTWYPSY
jgi:hypothetical protein